jgi:hypothetical protein
MPLARMDVFKGSTTLGYFVIDSPGIDQASILGYLTESDKGQISYKLSFGSYPHASGLAPEFHFLFRTNPQPLLPEDFAKRSYDYSTEKGYRVWITKLQTGHSLDQPTTD